MCWVGSFFVLTFLLCRFRPLCIFLVYSFGVPVLAFPFLTYWFICLSKKKKVCSYIPSDLESVQFQNVVSLLKRKFSLFYKIPIPKFWVIKQSPTEFLVMEWHHFCLKQQYTLSENLKELETIRIWKKGLNYTKGTIV